MCVCVINIDTSQKFVLGNGLRHKILVVDMANQKQRGQVAITMRSSSTAEYRVLHK